LVAEWPAPGESVEVPSPVMRITAAGWVLPHREHYLHDQEGRTMSMNTKHVVPLTDELTLVFTHDVLTGELVDVLVVDIGNIHVKEGAKS
jgi:hypothetical protein